MCNRYRNIKIINKSIISTGSQFQKPPQPTSWNAQKDPKNKAKKHNKNFQKKSYLYKNIVLKKFFFNLK